jgi:hypothetical protein
MPELFRPVGGAIPFRSWLKVCADVAVGVGELELLPFPCPYKAIVWRLAAFCVVKGGGGN